MTQFRTLSLRNWRQFELVELDLTAQTTVLTGANGCGKTSILTVLGHHFGWHVNFVSTPYISKRTKKKLYSEFLKMARSTHRLPDSDNDIDESAPPDQIPQIIGEISYMEGQTCIISSPSQTSVNPQYQLQYSALQNVTGLFIPSHRPAAIFQPVGQIPTNPQTSTQQYQEFQQLLLQSLHGGNVRNPGGVLKQSLISLAIFGYGNLAVLENSEYVEIFESFQEVLKAILPSNLGFQRLEIRMPDIVLITESGQFALDAMSGGINAIFTIAWQIQMFAWGKGPCTVIIDEPENHLHPSMQRSLLPSLAAAFPKHRFIVSTHSPFVVTSNPDAKIFALVSNENKRIVSHQLDNVDLSSSPEKVLKDILQVPSSIPIWVEMRIKEALRAYSGQEPTDPIALSNLFATLKDLGFNDSLGKLPEGRE